MTMQGSDMLWFVRTPGTDLRELVYREECRRNSGIEARLRYFSPSDLHRETHLVCLTSRGLVVADAALQPAPGVTSSG